MVKCYSSSQSYVVSPAISDDTPDTCERAPLNSSQTGWYSIYLLSGGMEGCVDLGVGYILRWFTCPQTVASLCSTGNHWIASDQELNPPLCNRKSNILVLDYQVTLWVL